MEKIVTNIISIVFSSTSLGTIIYLVTINKFIMKESIIISLVLANLLLVPQIIYLLIIFFLKFPDSQELSDWIVKKIKYRIIMVLFWFSLANLLFSYVLMFYEYSLVKPFARRLWIIEANMYISFNSIIYCGQLIQAKHKDSTKIRYIFYFTTIILSIIFLAHTTIFTIEMEFSSQIYLEIVMMLFTVQVWWKENPIFIYLLILAFEITSIVYALLEIQVYKQWMWVYALEISKVICIFTHVVIIIGILINKVRQFIRDTFSFDKKRTGLHPNLINLIEKTHLYYKNNGNTSLQNINTIFPNNHHHIPSAIYAEQKIECSICYTQIIDGAQIYNIPCKHIFHLDCLNNWLKIQNSCPSCRVEVI